MNDLKTNARDIFDEYLSPSLSATSRQCMQDIAQAIDLGAGEPFIRQGEGSEHLYFVSSGIVRYYILDQDGKERNKTFTTAPRIVGSAKALLTREPCGQSLVSLFDAQGLKIDWQAYCELKMARRDVARFYMTTLEQLFILKDERESSFLFYTAEQRYDKFVQDHPDCWQKIPQYQVASYLGITPVYLSRMLRNRKAKEG